MVENKVEQLIRPLVEELGYELWGCEYLSQGKHSTLRIYIDKNSGIGIDDCQKVSQEISALLDVEDPISSHYALEISSPGVPRPLFYSWQYQRYIEKEVQVKLYQPFEGKRKYTGAIVSADENSIVLMIEDTPRQFSLSNIVKANLKTE